MYFSKLLPLPVLKEYSCVGDDSWDLGAQWTLKGCPSWGLPTPAGCGRTAAAGWGVQGRSVYTRPAGLAAASVLGALTWARYRAAAAGSWGRAECRLLTVG